MKTTAANLESLELELDDARRSLAVAHVEVEHAVHELEAARRKRIEAFEVVFDAHRRVSRLRGKILALVPFE